MLIAPMIIFLTSQVFKIATVSLCSKNLDIHQITKIMEVQGYRKWYESLETDELKQSITQCVENSTKFSLKMVVCCESVSERMMSSIYRRVCPAENQSKMNNNIYCKILYFITRPETKKILFKIIKTFKVCHDVCPFDYPTMNTRVTRNLHTLVQKRQFDLASTFAILREQTCYDVLDGSTVLNYTLFKYLKFIENVWVGNDADQLFLGLVLLRRPACCLLKEQM